MGIMRQPSAQASNRDASPYQFENYTAMLCIVPGAAITSAIYTCRASPVRRHANSAGREDVTPFGRQAWFQVKGNHISLSNALPSTTIPLSAACLVISSL